MDEFKLSYPLAVDPDVMQTSFLGQLAVALGKMTGGMITDGTTLESWRDGLSLMSMQAILTEIGMEPFLMGLENSTDGETSFLAMSDGSIWRARIAVNNGSLEAVVTKPTAAEVGKDCAGLDEIGDLIKSIAADKLHQEGRVEKGDSVSGHVFTDAHSAICMRVNGKGKFVVTVGESSAIRGGFDFTLNCPRPNADMDTIASCLVVKEMTMDEIKELQAETKKNFEKTETAFPQKVGLA